MNSFLEDSTERISRLSNENDHDTLINEKKWEWGFLRVSKIFKFNKIKLVSNVIRKAKLWNKEKRM